MSSALSGVFTTLHFRIYDTGIFPFTVDVVNLGQVRRFRQLRIQNVIKIHRQEVDEAVAARGCHRITSVVRVCPGIRSCR